ncbi:MAG: class I SAM-dependent methyltransferase [Bacillota bacterium]|nr:class I SAM-dependent methyltransferase [Bacillota bacterium]
MDALKSSCLKEKIERHPGGYDTTMYLIKLSSIEPCKILDMGAGSGTTVKLLKKLGFDAFGIDLNPGEGVEKGDMLNTNFSNESFDAIISECSFFITKDSCKVLKEANRILKKGGKLLLSDIFYGDEKELCKFLMEGGFKPLLYKDITDKWKHYYIERIWDGTADEFCNLKHDRYSIKKFRYFLSVSERM